MPSKTRSEYSSGGAVISVREGVPYVALIATRGKTRWGLPKGAVAAGETSEAAALREVLEETGLRADIVKPLDAIEWVELSEAIRRASFASEKKLLESALQELEPSQASS